MSVDVEASAAPSEEEEEYPVAIGQVVDGRYRVDRYLGIGAMGLVVEARHLELDERVAIKFLRRSAAAQHDAVMRFAREARAAVRLRSEHVASVRDVGEIVGGTPYIVMEYLEGNDLDELIERGTPLGVQRSVELTIQLCEALAEAHSIGIVHRDIKPANIFLSRRSAGAPIAKLLDFGISKAALTGEYTDIKLDAQKTSVIMGTPLYMAPEQIRSTHDVDARADIWSLGVVLFELLCGQQVWRSTDLGQLVPEMISSSPRRLSEAMPGVDPALDAAISRALQIDLAERYATAADFAEALLPFAPPAAAVHAERARSYRQEAGSERSLPLLRQSSRNVVASSTPPSGYPGAAGGGRKSVIVAVGIAALALVGISVLVVPRLMASSDAPAPGASASATLTTAAPTAAPAPAPAPVIEAESATAPANSPAPPRPAAAPGVPAPPPRFGGRPSWPPPPRSAPAPAPAAAAASPAPSPTPAPKPSGNMDNDPWRSNQPKLEDNPFK